MSIAIHALFHDATDSKEREIAFFQYMKASRHFRNEYEKKFYAKAFPAPPKPPKTRAKKTEAPKRFRYSKEKSYNYGRLNIYPLLQEGKETHPDLYTYFLHLVEILYGKTLFQGNIALEKQLIDSLIATVKKENPKIVFLGKIRLNNPLFQPIYYRMVKGSKDIFSLLQYVSTEEHASKIYLPYASKEMLLTFFDEKMVEVLETKKASEMEIKKADLEILISSYSQEKQGSLWKFVTFEKKRPFSSYTSLLEGKADNETIFSRKVTIIPFVSEPKN
jgi:hypothetical protein